MLEKKSESRPVTGRIGVAISTPPRKRADFQRVVRDERARQPSQEEIANELSQ
jgi:hypothetical protein